MFADSDSPRLCTVVCIYRIWMGCLGSPCVQQSNSSTYNRQRQKCIEKRGFITVNMYLHHCFISFFDSVTRAEGWSTRAWHVHGFQSLGRWQYGDWGCITSCDELHAASGALWATAELHTWAWPLPCSSVQDLSQSRDSVHHWYILNPNRNPHTHASLDYTLSPVQTRDSQQDKIICSGVNWSVSTQASWWRRLQLSFLNHQRLVLEHLLFQQPISWWQSQFSTEEKDDHLINLLGKAVSVLYKTFRKNQALCSGLGGVNLC